MGMHDWHGKQRFNAIGAIAEFDFVTLSLFRSSINADIFHAWVTQDLLPKLPTGSVLVMDNASFHKRSDIVQTIQQSAMALEFLTAYSPDLNPIEHKWAQAKALKKRYRCSTKKLFRSFFNCVNLL